jgi:arabinogalactan oligomer / maltooligosaccharide transport system permease protein
MIWFRKSGWRHLVGVLAVIFAVFPVVWVIGVAFSKDASLSSRQLVPKELSLANYRRLLSDPGHPEFWRWLFNSVWIGAVTAALQVFLSSLGAFAFSRLRFKGRRPAMLMLLLVQMFPNLLAIVALFLFMVQLKKLFPAIGIGTDIGLILIYLGGSMGVNTWLMKGFFDTIPIDLDEAAKIDGATHAQTYFKVILPLGAPVLAVIGLLSFVATQAEFLFADVIIGPKPKMQTVPSGLARYVLSGFDNNWGPFAAGALIHAVPTVVLFLFLQRFIVEGLTSGAVKG